MLSKEQVSTLLNRPLTTAEDTNFKLYLNIAMERLEELLCLTLCGDDGERTYETRLGYRTVYVDPFTDITSVSINGDEVDSDGYTIRQNDKFNGSWYNIIEFDRKRNIQKITVDADWGFGSLPYDLQTLLAQLFNQGTIEQTADNNIKSKKIEDFTVTFKDNATYDEFVNANSSVISKYSQCNQGAIRHGSVKEYDYIRPFYPY